MAKREAKILVVDDERFFREAIRDALSAARIACDTAETGSEALRAAADPRIGVVVLDIRLPDIDGIEVLRRLRQQRPALRVIMLSAHTEQELVLEALRLEACDYLAKPLHDEELVLAVRRAQHAHATETGRDGLRERASALEAQCEALAQRAARSAPGERARNLAGRAVESAAALLDAEKISVLWLDASGEALRVAAAHGREGIELEPVRVGEGVAGRIFAEGRAAAVADLDADPRFRDRTPRPDYATRSCVAAVISAGGERRGVLCAADRRDGAAFDDEDLVWLRLLALHLGALLAGGASAAEPRPSLGAPQPGAAAGVDDAELARLVCDALTSEVEPARVLDAVLRPVAQRLGAEPVAVHLIDASGELALEAQWAGRGAGDRDKLSRSRGLTAVVLQTGRLVATDRPESDPRFDPDADTPEGGDVLPLLCVPLRLRGKVLGVMRAFPAGGASARTGEVLGAVLSAAIRNVLLYRSLLDSIDDLARARREAQHRAESRTEPR